VIFVIFVFDFWMALDEYRKKRNFQKSPEPEGKAQSGKSKGKQLFFCVQKHLASHLHYDLRLEWNGVLLSWAVPKGPSLNPKDKRLAMHVEDHPIEYGDFEGVIPEGYGAGIVMLWDQGTWQSESEDVDAALKKGDLKFTLEGYKLKGSWVLVRTHGYSGGGKPGKSWLLIKHRDDWAGELDITEFAPLSVKTPDADLADILAADNPAIWTSNRPAQGGDTGQMFAKIVERALEIKEGRTAGTAPDKITNTNTKGTKGTKDKAQKAKTQKAKTQKPKATTSAGKPRAREEP
jgi:bifunctional non-homologous end joining protein LigD